MNKNILILMLALFLVSSVSAQLIYEVETTVDLKIPCENDGAYCSASSECNITVINPDGDALVDNELMTNANAYHNYTINETQTADTGYHVVNVVCIDGTDAGFSTFEISITPNGEEASTANGLLYLGIFAVLLLFFVLTIFGFTKSENVVIKTALLNASYLLMIGVSFIAWNIADDFLTSAPFLISFLRIIFWVFISGLFPFILVSFLYCGYMLYKIKEIENLVEKGMPHDEAFSRSMKKRGKW